MPHASKLTIAAAVAFANLSNWWQIDQMTPKVLAFSEATIDLYPQQIVQFNPASNWITVFWALGARLPATAVPIEQLNAAAAILYRMCWMANTLKSVAGSPDVAFLAAYNAIIAF